MLRILQLILITLLGFTLSGHAQQKRALIICVGEQQDKDWADLNAENDLQYVRKLLDFCT